MLFFSDLDNIVERVANIMTTEDEQSLTKSWRSQFEEYVNHDVQAKHFYLSLQGGFLLIKLLCFYC